MGSPGWPEFAFWTASMARQRMVLIESWSSCAWSSADFWVWVVAPVGKMVLRDGSISECERQGATESLPRYRFWMLPTLSMLPSLIIQRCSQRTYACDSEDRRP